jgi:type I restriction enzyme S subunit
MTRELPAGWARATLGDIGDYLNGRGFKKSEWSDTGRPIIRIQNLTGTSEQFNHFNGEPEPHYTVRQGDLLMSWAATLGVFVWKGPEAVVNQHIFKVRSHIDPGFHRYLLLSILDDLKRQTHGSGIVHITKGRFESTPVAIPPLDEQRRIVAAIEEQFSRLDAGQRALDGARRRLRILRRCCYSLATSVGDPLPLGDLLDDIEAGKSFRCEPRAAGSHEWGVIRVSAMTWGSFDETQNKAVVDTDKVDPRWEIRPGDLLLSRANTFDYVGATVVVNQCRPRLLLSDKSMRLQVKRDVDKTWLLLALSAPEARAQMSSLATGTSDSMRNISQEKVRNVVLRVPSLDDQRLAVAEIERRISLVDALSSATDRALPTAQALGRSILERAFAGDLAVQDVADEPASVLIERIAAAGAHDQHAKRASHIRKMSA